MVVCGQELGESAFLSATWFFEAIENPESVKKWLPRSIVLAVVRRCEEIVGVGAIKPARPSYAARVAAMSKHALPPAST